MKRRKLIKEVENNGWWIKRHGAEHDIYTNGSSDVAVPRHPDVNEETAKEIIKKVRRV
ncbi:MAG: toxin-antitoxin system, toxin component, HicA family protein [Lachnospiraceae bacterium]|nr:toxin-antitoxin system, toxin component, HicA family protein [Lachnospiraceae bacterium]